MTYDSYPLGTSVIKRIPEGCLDAQNEENSLQSKKEKKFKASLKWVRTNKISWLWCILSVMMKFWWWDFFQWLYLIPFHLFQFCVICTTRNNVIMRQKTIHLLVWGAKLTVTGKNDVLLYDKKKIFLLSNIINVKELMGKVPICLCWESKNQTTFKMWKCEYVFWSRTSDT